MYGSKLLTPISDLTTVKYHINKVISTVGTRYAIDIKDLYLGTHLAEYEYTRIPLKISQAKSYNNTGSITYPKTIT